MKLMFCAGFMLAMLISPVVAEETPKPIWLAVVKPIFVEALTPLANERREEGFDVIVSTLPVDQALAAAGRRPAFLLLVGDYELACRPSRGICRPSE